MNLTIQKPVPTPNPNGLSATGALHRPHESSSTRPHDSQSIGGPNSQGPEVGVQQAREVAPFRPVDEVHVSNEATETRRLGQSPEVQSIAGHSDVQALLQNFSSPVCSVADSKTVQGLDTKNSNEKLASSDAAIKNSSADAARLCQSKQIQVLDISQGSDSKGLGHRPGPQVQAGLELDQVGADPLTHGSEVAKDPLKSTFTPSAELKEFALSQKVATPGHLAAA